MGLPVQSVASKYEPYPQRSTPCDWCAGHNGPLGHERIKRRIALPGHGAGLAIRGLRDGDIIVVVDHGEPFPQPPKPFENLVVVPGAAKLAQPISQVSKIGFEAFTLLRQNGLILLLMGLAPDAQLRLLLMVMGQFPDPRLLHRSGFDRRIGFLSVHSVYLIRLHPEFSNAKRYFRILTPSRGSEIFLTFCCAYRYAEVMEVRSDIFPGSPDGFHPRDVSVCLARPDERTRRDRLMDQHHYLDFKRFAGRGLRYVLEWRGHWVGLAGWQSGAFNLNSVAGAKK